MKYDSYSIITLSFVESQKLFDEYLCMFKFIFFLTGVLLIKAS